MRKKSTGLQIYLFVLFLSFQGCTSPDSQPAKSTKQTAAIQFEIIVDDTNSIQALIQAMAGENARDVMKRLFSVEFAGSDEKFITSIAGFKADTNRKEYWGLQVNGETSMVGIAEIIIQDGMHLRWEKKKY